MLESSSSALCERIKRYMQESRDLTSNGHKMTLNGHRVKISLQCTFISYDELTTSISKGSDN